MPNQLNNKKSNTCLRRQPSAQGGQVVCMKLEAGERRQQNCAEIEAVDKGTVGKLENDGMNAWVERLTKAQ